MQDVLILFYIVNSHIYIIYLYIYIYIDTYVLPTAANIWVSENWYISITCKYYTKKLL